MIIAEMHFLDAPAGATLEWRTAARVAEELRAELKAAQAQAFLTPPCAEGQRVTDGQREAYATVQTADLAKRAAVAAVEAEVAERWAEFVLECGTRDRERSELARAEVAERGRDEEKAAHARTIDHAGEMTERCYKAEEERDEARERLAGWISRAEAAEHALEELRLECETTSEQAELAEAIETLELERAAHRVTAKRLEEARKLAEDAYDRLERKP